MKLIRVLLIVGMTVVNVYGRSVSPEDAIRATSKWVDLCAAHTFENIGTPSNDVRVFTNTNQNSSTSLSTRSVTSGTKVSTTEEETGPLFYAIPMSGGGVTLIAGDTRLSPIIAFIPNGDVSTLSDNHPLIALARRDMSAQLALLNTSSEGTIRASASSVTPTFEHAAWTQLLSNTIAPRAITSPDGGSDVRVPAFLATTWRQRVNAYYPSTPIDAGCVPVALAQVLYHNGKRFNHLQRNAFTGYFEPYNATALTETTFAARTMDYASMQTGASTTMPDTIARLYWEVANAINANANSIGGVDGEIENFFLCDPWQYDAVSQMRVYNRINNRHKKIWNYADGHFGHFNEACIYANLDAGLPVVMSIHTTGNVGHAVVLDGYMIQTSLVTKPRFTHINFGWGNDDNSNAWYEFGATEERIRSKDYINYNMHPQKAGEWISGRVFGLDGTSVQSGATVTIAQNGTVLDSTTSNDNGIFAVCIPEANTTIASQSYTLTATKDNNSATRTVSTTSSNSWFSRFFASDQEAEYTDGTAPDYRYGCRYEQNLNLAETTSNWTMTPDRGATNQADNVSWGNFRLDRTSSFSQNNPPDSLPAFVGIHSIAIKWHPTRTPASSITALVIAKTDGTVYAISSEMRGALAMNGKTTFTFASTPQLNRAQTYRLYFVTSATQTIGLPVANTVNAAVTLYGTSDAEQKSGNGTTGIYNFAIAATYELEALPREATAFTLGLYGIPLDNNYTARTSAAGSSGRKFITENTIFTFTSNGAVGVSDNAGFTSYDNHVKLMTESDTQQMNVNGPFLLTRSAWFARGRWGINAATLLTQIEALYVAGGQLFLSGENQTCNRPLTLGACTYSEGVYGNAALRVEGSWTFGQTHIAEATTLSFRGGNNHSLTVNSLTGSSDLRLNVIDGMGYTFAVTNPVSLYTGHITVPAGMTLSLPHTTQSSLNQLSLIGGTITSATPVTATTVTLTGNATADLHVTDVLHITETNTTLTGSLTLDTPILLEIPTISVSEETPLLTIPDGIPAASLFHCADSSIRLFTRGDTLYAKSMTYEVISINLAGSFSAERTGLSVSGDTLYGAIPVAGKYWKNLTNLNNTQLGNITNSAGVALSTVTVSSSGPNNYTTGVAGGGIFYSYIDDGGTPTVRIDGLTSTNGYNGTCTVYVYMATDSADRAFYAPTVNGTRYTFVNNETQAGTSDWGASNSNLTGTQIGVPVEGLNYLKILNVPVINGSVTVTSGRSNISIHRGGIAAVQVLIPTMTITDVAATVTSDGNWTTQNWNPAVAATDWDAAQEYHVSLTAAANATLTVDTATSFNSLSLIGANDLTLTLRNEASFETYAIDCSTATGTTTFDLATGAANIIAGENTILTQAGSGTLTIAAGNCATVRDAVWSGGINGAGTLVYDAIGNTTILATPTPTTRYAGATTVTLANTYTTTKDKSITFTDGAALVSTQATTIADPDASATNNGGSMPGFRFRPSTSVTFSAGATFSMTNGYLELCWDNEPANTDSGTFTITGNGSRVSVRGIGGGNIYSGNVSLNIADGGVLEIGAMGLRHASTANLYTLAMNNGSLRAAGNFGVESGIGMTLAASTTNTFDTSTHMITYSQVITGEGALKKTGTGTLVLGAANTYAGGTTIAEGTVQLTHTTGLGTGVTTLASGTTLDLTTLALGATPMTTLAAGENLSPSAKTTLRLKMTNAQRDLKTVLSVATLATGMTIDMLNIIVVGDDDTTTRAAIEYTVSVEANVLKITGISAALMWQGDAAGDGTWSTSASDTPWTGEAFSNGRSVVFGALATGVSADVTVAGSIQPFLMQFENGNTPYTFTAGEDGLLEANALLTAEGGALVTIATPLKTSSAITMGAGSHLTLGAPFGATVAANATAGTYANTLTIPENTTITIAPGEGKTQTIHTFTPANATSQLIVGPGLLAADSAGGATGIFGNTSVTVAHGGILLFNQIDISGYDIQNNPIVVEAGGELRYEYRDTLQRGVTLKGGKMTIKNEQGDDAGYRSLDLFRTQTIAVTADSTIEGVAGGTRVGNTSVAVPNPIIWLRGSGDTQYTTTFDVASSTTLTCSATFASNGNNALKKSGDGKMIQNGMTNTVAGGRYPLTYTSPTQIAAGTYELNVEHQNGAGTYTVSDGAKLSGTGSITGAGVVTLQTNAALEGGLTINNLTFSGATARLFAGDATQMICVTGTTVFPTALTLSVSLGDRTFTEDTQIMAWTAAPTGVTATLMDGTLPEGYELGVRNDGLYVQLRRLTSPFRVTVTEDVAWASLAWRDANGEEIPADYEWNAATSIDVELTVSGAATVTALADVNVGTITVTAIQPLILTAVDGVTFTAAACNDSASTAKVTVGVTATSITAGADTVVQQPSTGTLTIAANKKATLMAPWTGTVSNFGTLEYAYAASAFASTANATVIYSAGGTATTALGMNGGTIYLTGATAYSVPSVTQNSTQTELVISSPLQATSLDFGKATLSIDTGAAVEVEQFGMSDGAGNRTGILNMRGGVLTATGVDGEADANFTTFRLAHWPGTVTANLSSGTINIPNGHFFISRDGTVTVNATGTEVNAKGLRFKTHENTNRATLNLNGGTFRIGAYGVKTANAGATTFALGGGTLAASTNWTGSVSATLDANTTSTFDTAAYTITYSGVLSGAGTLRKTGSGTLNLTGANTYSGGTVLEAGTLTLNSAPTTRAVTMHGNTTLALNIALTPDTTPVALTSADDMTTTAKGTICVTMTDAQLLFSVPLKVATLADTTNWDERFIVRVLNAAGDERDDCIVALDQSTLTIAPIHPAQTWTGAGTDDAWQTGANWATGIAPFVGLTDIYFAGTTQLTNRNTIANLSFESLTFLQNAGAFYLGGTAPIAVATIANQSTTAKTLAMPIDNGVSPLTVSSTSGDMALLGGITAGTFDQIGIYAMTLGGTNSLGAMTINGKTRFTNGSTTAGAITLGDSGDITVAPGASLTAESLTYNRSPGGENKTFTIYGDTYFRGGISLTVQSWGNHRVIISNATLRVKSFNAGGYGTANITGMNEQSRMELGSGGFTRAGWGTYVLDYTIQNVTLGAYEDWSIAAGVSFNPKFMGTVIVDTYDSNANASRTITFNKTVIGTGNLVKTGSGTLVLNAVNTYTGTTIVNGGTLTLGTLNAVTKALTLANNTVLDVSTLNTTTTNTLVTVAAGDTAIIHVGTREMTQGLKIMSWSTMPAGEFRFTGTALGRFVATKKDDGLYAEEPDFGGLILRIR